MRCLAPGQVRVGLPVEHNPADRGPVCWRYCNVSAGRHDWDVCRGVLERFAGARGTLRLTTAAHTETSHNCSFDANWD